jgi:hypothetical protein
MIHSRSGFLLTLLLVFQFQMANGQTNRPVPERFRKERAIIAGGSGPNRLLIDAAVLSGSSSSWNFYQRTTGSDREPMTIATGGMRDLRIYDSTNREVPYLLILPPAPESTWTEARLSPLAVTKKTSGFQIDLGHPMLVDGVRLEGLPAPYVKRCILEAGNSGEDWRVLDRDATIYDLPAQKLKLDEIEFHPSEYRYIKITWDDNASARIPMPHSAEVRLVSAGVLPPRLQVPLQFERRGSEPGISRYRIHLPGPNLPVTGITLSVSGGNVLRQAQVTEARLSGDVMAPALLGKAILRREVHGDLTAEEMSIAVTSPREAQIDLVIEDGNNPSLHLTGITAVFAYLPWVYFESADGNPLTARYGYPDLAGPRYDLEAARESAAKAETLEARWGEIRPSGMVVESTTATEMPVTGSSIDTAGFRYARDIVAGEPGLNTLPLDPAVLAHSRIADLRIAGNDGRQVPYLIENADEPLALDLPLLEKTEAPRTKSFSARNGTDTRSFYRLRLPYENLPAARLVLTTSARIFNRRIYVMVENNPRNERQEPWVESVADAVWSNTDPGLAAAALMLRIPTLRTKEAQIVVEEGDNSALPITSVKLLLPTHRLRFFQGTENSLKLYYGRSDLGPPRYDLAILAPQLVGAAAKDAKLGPETEASSVTVKPLSIKLFWVILVAAVLILVLLIARLLKKAEVK